VIAIVLIPVTPAGVPVLAACAALALGTDPRVLRTLRGRLTSRRSS
jgi:hypothetical protein